jgi:hypothetical protein
MDRAKFFDICRANLFGGVLSQTQVNGLTILLDAMLSARWPLGWAAYGLATAKWETAHTMQPIAEYGRGAGRKYGRPDPRTGHTYYGRGFVQLTWDYNYEKAGEKLRLDLLNKPDLAMKPDVAARIMIRGMVEGWFTGKTLAAYTRRGVVDYIGARRIINGNDRAVLIARIAEGFEAALRAAGYEAAQMRQEPEETRVAPTPPATPLPRQPDDPGPRAAPGKPGWWSRLRALVGRT